MNQQLRENAIRAMEDYFHSTTPKAEERIAHTLSVLSNAERILDGEKVTSVFIEQTVVFGALFHDIGIPEAERKYDSSEPEYQHREGPPITRARLGELGVRPDVLERTCYIVANHHTRAKIDNVDFQIVYEADYLVNTASARKVHSEGSAKAVVPQSYDEHLHSATAIRLANQLK